MGMDRTERRRERERGEEVTRRYEKRGKERSREITRGEVRRRYEKRREERSREIKRGEVKRRYVKNASIRNQRETDAKSQSNKHAYENEGTQIFIKIDGLTGQMDETKAYCIDGECYDRSQVSLIKSRGGRYAYHCVTFK